jgi:hypothetical protein
MPAGLEKRRKRKIPMATMRATSASMIQHARRRPRPNFTWLRSTPPAKSRTAPFSAGSSGIRPYNTACRTSQRCTAGRRCRSISHLSTASVGGPRQLEPSRRLGRSPAAKQLVTGLFDEVVSAHIAVSLPQLVPAFRATLPAERSGHALDNCGEHRCVLTNNTRMIPGDLT